MNKKNKIKGLMNMVKGILTIVFFLTSVHVFAQSLGSASFGNVYVHSGGEMNIFGNHTFVPGIIGTERDSPMGFVGFAPNATYTGAGDNKMVDGYVKSYKSGDFIFPIGDNGKYRPAKISASDATTPTNAAYFGVGPDSAITSKPFSKTNFPILPSSGPFSTSALGDKVSAVDNKEYWDINGTKEAIISLSWDANSDITNLVKGDLKKLTIVGWDGTQWVKIPSLVDGSSFLGATSDLTSGSISTEAAIVPNTYEVYTLGFACDTPKGKPVFACNIPVCDSICKSNSPTVQFKVTGFTDAIGYIWTANNGIVILSGQNTDSATFDITGAAGTATISVQAYSLCDTGSAFGKTFFVFDCPKTNIDDTTISTKPGNNVVIGPSVTPGPGATVTTEVKGPFHGAGTATIDETGVVTFVPNDTPFVGKDTVMRIVCIKFADSTEKCDTSYIFVNNPPLFFVDSAVTPMDSPVTFPALGPVVFEGNPLEPVVDPTLTINADGTVTYTPPKGFIGIDTAVITRCDDKGNCVTNTYIITVGPYLPNDTAFIVQDTKHDFKNPVIVANGTMTITAQNPSKGTVSVVNNVVTYTPNPGYVGEDSFVRIICVEYANGVVLCDTAMCYITITRRSEDNTATVIPNYFTPNGDGLNDNFDLSLLTKQYPNLKLSVYNRWGNIVYRSVGAYNNDWDGTHGVNNQQVPDGVYYYIIELAPNFDDVKTGFIQIMRQ